MFVHVERRQTMLFSATQTRRTEDLAKISLKKEPLYVGVDDTSEQATVEGLEQVNYSSNIIENVIDYCVGLCCRTARQTFSSSIYLLEKESKEENDGLFFIMYGREILQ